MKRVLRIAIALLLVGTVARFGGLATADDQCSRLVSDVTELVSRRDIAALVPSEVEKRFESIVTLVAGSKTEAWLAYVGARKSGGVPWARVEFQDSAGTPAAWQFVQMAIALNCGGQDLETMQNAVSKALQAQLGKAAMRGRALFWRNGKDLEVMVKNGEFENPLEEGKMHKVVLIEVAVPQGDEE